MNRKRFLITSICMLLVASFAFSQTVWKKYEGNPVLVPTEAWEASYGLIGPRVLKISNQYKMWYTGLDLRRQLGLATSEDGIHWTKFNENPVLRHGNPGSFDSEHIQYGAVLFINDQYWMWYSGHNGQAWQIGLATSSDGIQWTKHPNNPVLTIGNSGEWDSQGLPGTAVLYDGHVFRMWYSGNGPQYAQAAGYAESSDGIHWQKHPNNPVLTPVPGPWEANAIGINTVLYIDGVYQAWYVGNTNVPGYGTRASLGLATSNDGINWQRYAGNPLVTPGENGAWDSITLGGYWVMQENDTYKIWYCGRRDDIWKIGYAESMANGQDDYALSFDGNDDFVRIPDMNNSLDLTSFTIECWVQIKTDGKIHELVVKDAYGEDPSVNSNYSFDVWSDQKLRIVFENENQDNQELFSNTKLGVGKTYHVAATFDANTNALTLYLNGQIDGGPMVVIGKPNRQDQPLRIGTGFDGSPRTTTQGIIDEVRIWNIARSQSAIAADMLSRLQGNEPGLVGYWRFDEGEGQNVYDLSPFQNHGQLGSLSTIDSSDPVWVVSPVGGLPCIPLPASEAYGNINASNSSYPDKVTYCFAGQASSLYLSFQAHDIDTNQEVDVLLNGVNIFDVPLTANNSWSGLLGVLLPDELIHDHGDNELIFDNTKNPPQSLIWGVRRVSVDPFYALPSTAAYGKIQGGDQAHADKVVYFFSGRPGDLNLIYEVYDIDNINELDVLLNGAKIHDELPTINYNTWSKPRTMRLPDALVHDAGINVLIFDSPSNPPHQWNWGVRNVRVEVAPNASIALDLSQSVIAEANMARDGQYLFDGRSTPPARLETDDNAVIEGATTIAPNGYLVVDLQTVRQFDYLQLYPEWNTQRYFTYRVEASQNSKEWQTVIDKSESFVHGIQLDELPTTQARFLRIRGASFMADVDALPMAELSEEAYWHMHDELVNHADSTDLAIAELALFQKQSQLSVASDANSLPVSYDLAQNFPNPFNPVTTIEFALPRSAKVKLVVYDLRGAIVRILEEGELPAGFHARTFDTVGLASGIYLYQLQAGEFTATRKMVLAK